MYDAVQLPLYIENLPTKNRLFSLSLREKPEAAAAAVCCICDSDSLCMAKFSFASMVVASNTLSRIFALTIMLI